MQPTLHSVDDLPTSARQALAAVSGLPLEGRSQFYVVVLNETDQERRDRTWAEMQRIAATAQRNIQASGIAPQDLDALVDDVCRETRDGRGT